MFRPTTLAAAKSTLHSHLTFSALLSLRRVASGLTADGEAHVTRSRGGGCCVDSVWTVLLQTVKRAPASFDMHQVFTVRISFSTFSALRYLLIPAFTHKNAPTEQLKNHHSITE